MRHGDGMLAIQTFLDFALFQTRSVQFFPGFRTKTATT
jgi:hypothetical protein